MKCLRLLKMYSINLQGPFGANYTVIDRLKPPKTGKLKISHKSKL